MGLTALHVFLWLLTALSLTTQELVKLSVSPKITAECGKQVALNCEVSSSRNGLSIKHMEWFANKTSLCSVNREGEIRTHRKHTLSAFQCKYEHGQLTLIFEEVQPLESGHSMPYRCKLQSNRGAAHEYTTVELQECCGITKGLSTTNNQICTFNRVYPDGDVYWLDGSGNLLDRSLHSTTKHVDNKGWLTISSYLEQKSSDMPYNCSLMSTRSGTYIASTLVQDRRSPVKNLQTTNEAGSLGLMRTLLCVPIFLALTQK